MVSLLFLFRSLFTKEEDQKSKFELCHTYFILAIGVSLAIISQVPVIMGCFGPLNLEHPLTGGPTKLIRLCVAIIWLKLLLIGSSVHLR